MSRWDVLYYIMAGIITFIVIGYCVAVLWFVFSQILI